MADAPEDNPDTMGIDGTMKFFGDIQVQLDEVACFGVAELLKSPSMGEFTREGFVNGWKSVGFVFLFLIFPPPRACESILIFKANAVATH